MRWRALLAVVAALSAFVGVGQVGAQSTLGAPAASVSSPTTNTLTVTWTAPSDNGGAVITAYQLRYILTAADETVDANWTEKDEDIWVTGGGALSYTLDELPDGVAYDVQVRAENDDGDVGPWSSTAAGTTTDHGDTTGTATDLSLGSSLAGRLDPATDEDVFKIVLGSDGEVWIYATGPLAMVGELLDSSGAVVAEADDGTLLAAPYGFEFREELDAGTYYVRVSSYRDKAAGFYTIHAQTFTDPGDTFATATTVTLDSATPGRIGPVGGDPEDPDHPGDADYFKLVLTATTEVLVIAYGALDTTGSLYNERQYWIRNYDDSGFGRNPNTFVFRRELLPGTYYIDVWGLHSFDVGPYTLHVRTATELSSTSMTPTPLTIGVPETDRITSATDKDFFSFTLEEETYVTIYGLDLERERGVDFASVVRLAPTILDSQETPAPMHLIPYESWREHGPQSRSFSLWGKLEAGTYRLEISSANGSIGAYLVDSFVSPYGRLVDECTGLTTAQSDPWYGCQWHLNNTGQFGGGAMQDINVESVWSGGNMGAGINVVVVDDGLESDHEDLVDNVLTDLNHDFASQGGVYDDLETHGTAVAGLIAARDNDIGVRGVAPRANVFSYNLIARGGVSLLHYTVAMYRAEDAEQTAISTNSWGFFNAGDPKRPASTWENAVESGVGEGYGGKGILYVWAAGNGHLADDNSNLDGRANFYAVTAACAVGYDDKRSVYSEMGANLWVCAPSDGGEPLPEITTTDIPDRYRADFGGTSAAAPIVSGVAALVRAANTNLSWRDVKLILAASARKNDPTNTGWEQGELTYGSTSDRYDFNHEYGFGMVDAAAAVALAGSWSNVPDMLRTSEAESGPLSDTPGSTGILLPDRDGETVTTVSRSLNLDGYVPFIEFVEVEIELRHGFFRDLQIEIESPSGAVSELSVPSMLADGQFNSSHRFGSAKHLGESAEGTWTLKLTDRQSGDSGKLLSWRLKVYGHGHNPGHFGIDDVVPGPGAFTLTWQAPDDIGASAVTRYDLRYILADAIDPNDWEEVTNVGSTSELPYTLTGLEGETKYFLAMRAVNDAGEGPWSAPFGEDTQSITPGVPRSVRVAARNEGLAVSWAEPTYVGAGRIEAYHIRYIDKAAPNKDDIHWTPLNSVWRAGGGELRDVIRGLVNGTEYEVQVRAENSREEGDWSGVVSGTPRDVNGPAEFPNTETGQRSIPENTPAGVDIGDPVAARDDEGDTLTYSLTSGAANFDIDTTTGQLQTEIPLDRELTSSYAVTVAVHDGKASNGTASTATDDTIRVVITIEDVDEPPTVTGSGTLAVLENSTAVATYRAQDPERVTSAFTWSLDGDDANAFALSSSGVLTFDPAPNFEAPTDSVPRNVYEVTVRATDESAVDPDAQTGELAVQVTVEDVGEPPVIDGIDSYTIVENSSTFVGSYTASDPEGDDTTWLSLTGTDARHFTLDEFGTLSFVESPDYDRETNGNHGDTYYVILRASDEGNRIGSLTVTITLEDAPEPPVIGGPAAVTVNEGHTSTVGTYTRRDPEGGATNWGPVGSSVALTGPDAADFEFDQATGRLTFAAPARLRGRRRPLRGHP